MSNLVVTSCDCNYQIKYTSRIVTNVFVIELLKIEPHQCNVKYQCKRKHRKHISHFLFFSVIHYHYHPIAPSEVQSVSTLICLRLLADNSGFGLRLADMKIVTFTDPFSATIRLVVFIE